jgi:hypothetical protein
MTPRVRREKYTGLGTKNYCADKGSSNLPELVDRPVQGVCYKVISTLKVGSFLGYG